MKIFAWIIEIFFGILVALSPSLIGVIFGAFIYMAYPSQFGKIVSISIIVLFVVLGIWFAIWAHRKYGLSMFYSRINGSTPIRDEYLKKWQNERKLVEDDD